MLDPFKAVRAVPTPVKLVPVTSPASLTVKTADPVARLATLFLIVKLAPEPLLSLSNNITTLWLEANTRPEPISTYTQLLELLPEKLVGVALAVVNS
jgi:hypothetical protein